eukprot:1001253-Rhodomonas_salina.3
MARPGGGNWRPLQFEIGDFRQRNSEPARGPGDQRSPVISLAPGLRLTIACDQPDSEPEFTVPRVKGVQPFRVDTTEELTRSAPYPGHGSLRAGLSLSLP